jgi:hypothetical protein
MVKDSRCEAYRTWTDYGWEYDCGYNIDDFSCDDCIYCGGELDPEKVIEELEKKNG